MSEQEKTAEMPLGHAYLQINERPICGFLVKLFNPPGFKFCGQPESAHLPAPSEEKSMYRTHADFGPRLERTHELNEKPPVTWVPARMKPMCAPDEWESEFYEQGDVATRVRRPASPETPPSDGELDSNGASAEDHLEAISNCCAPCLGCLTAIQAYGDARAQQAAKEERARVANTLWAAGIVTSTQADKI